MKTFKKMAAQGDFVIFRVKSIPSNATEIAPEKNKIVVAHSETGHDHVMLADRVTAYVVPQTGTEDRNLFEMFLKVEAPTPIEHLRSYHTHEPILVEPGLYTIRRQREYVAEGFRKAQD